MTADTQIKPPADAVVDQRPTAPLEGAADESILDAFELLDHRARSRAVPRALARRGAYLAFADGDDTHLVALEPKITHIGRGLTSHLRIEEHRVSRSHAILVRHGRFTR